ncbi:flagellin [Bosea sp. (in: a-proteobacteria)]|uniref:flagellin N-terminal helical domain-containing protein n=1 Tax=Bosea sp. (in: a-proteobacteria) TaxID=1871050 RepID=UPI0027334DC7|nr:flagellin [Bosea sp. (in: a-proteobacteria)]MDP3408111.1 flagellin [Bosea sp. (in: a-proteobacteria)]
MADISISARVRTGLLALQQINDQTTLAQQRLTTGRKVNSAVDNPVNYFTSAALNDRAGDLGALLDGIGNAQKVVEAADKGIQSITKLVQTAKGLASAARQLASTDTAGRLALSVQYNEIQSQITSLAEDSGFNGLNLIKATPDNLTVRFSERATAAAPAPKNDLTVTGVALGAAGLSLVAATGSWATNGNVDTDIGLLDAALGKLRATASTLGANGAIITSRQDFTKQLMSVLKVGADNLVLADQNEEAANLLALQTRQQLAQTGMSLANQADQSVLRLFN